MTKPLFVMIGTLWAHSVFAGGPIMVDSFGTGGPVLWKDGVVHINMEGGESATLGELSNGEAVDLVRDLFADWQNATLDGVATASLSLEEGASLGSVSLSNLEDHFTYCPADKFCPTEGAPFVLGSAGTGESPIIFDDDGSVTDEILGEGAHLSTLGFAGPRVVERIDGVLYIVEGQAVLNGRFINGVNTAADPEVPLEEFKGAVFHEIGHLIGLDHTQINIGSVIKYQKSDFSEAHAIPTMFPFFVDGIEQQTPHYDDVVALSSLYPSEGYDHFCHLSGIVYRVDGETELQGVNLIAASTEDPLDEAASFVSGSYFTGSNTSCGAKSGGYEIGGLRPGKTYTLSLEPISPVFTGGSSIEPCDPPQSGFDRQTVPGIFTCEKDGDIITVGSEATTAVTTTKTTAPGTVPDDTASSSTGGCQLMTE